MKSYESKRIMNLVEQYALDVSTYITCQDDEIASKIKNKLEDQKAVITVAIDMLVPRGY